MLTTIFTLKPVQQTQWVMFGMLGVYIFKLASASF